MTQVIVDNAAAISLDRDVTVGQTISNSRNLKWFRKGPFQTVAQIQLNVITRGIYNQIIATQAGNIIGPYNMQFLSEVVDTPLIRAPMVRGAGQSGASINIDFDTDLNIGDVAVAAGTWIQFPSHSQTYIVTANALATTSRNATIVLDQPVHQTVIDNEVIRSGSEIIFSMYLVNKPRASFGPTGLINHDGPFTFVEDLS